MDSKSIKKLLKRLANTRDEELSCDECFDVLDVFAEMAAQGEDPARYMPLVQQHLEMCPDCKQEFQALVDVLEQEDKTSQN